LDFSYETNNWAVGLPPKNKNGFKWSIMRELLGDPSLKPTKMHILAAVENLKELLRIRFSSPLFRLTTANAVQARLRFHNTGPGSIPGVIIYSIEDGTEGKPGLMQLDFKYRFQTQTLPVSVQNSRKLSIHVQKTYTSIWVPDFWVGVFKFSVV
jgi:pullulanase